MGIDNARVIDSMYPDDDFKCLIMNLFDWFEWTETTNQEHITMLADKMNAYCVYWEEREYKEIEKYKETGIDFKYALINIYTLYKPSEYGIEFINYAEHKLIESDSNIRIGNIYVGERATGML